MKHFTPILLLPIAALAIVWLTTASAQPPGDFQPFGLGGPGGTRKIVKDFDQDGDGRLNAEERKAAREGTAKKKGGGFFGKGPGMGKGKQDPPQRGPAVKLDDAKSYADAGLYEPTVLRTVFLEFDNPDWEAELADFYHTDVDVPATLIVDGKKYPNVGVHFRGMSSFMGVSPGYKRSLNLSLDFADDKQRLYGAKTLNLLNGHDDPSLMSTVLYSHIARQHLAAPKANFVKVVINGESWGVYANVQQFDKVFLKENYKTDKGTRWKVRGSPGGQGGLDYIGDNVDDYKRRYEMKSKEDEKAWKALINLCKTLNKTPADKLEEALKPIVDIDSLLWFLALDVGLVNNDGYWVRASDYSIYLDDKGKFHFLPHDMNEAFHGGGMGPPMGGGGGRGGMGGGMRMPQPGEILPGPIQDMIGMSDEQKKQLDQLQKEVDEKVAKILNDEQRKQLKDMRERGPGGFGPPMGFGPPGGGMGGGGINLDPLVGMTDERKPLRSKVLAVPSLKAKYLQNVRTIAEDSLDWKKLGPVVGQYRNLIEKEVENDTHKLDSLASFKKLTADDGTDTNGREMSLRSFADQRRKFLLNHAEVKKAAP